MKSIATGILMSLVFLAGAAGVQAADAGPKIAVLDMAQALFNSERAKQVDNELAQETAEDQQRVRELATEAQGLQEQLQKDAAVLSDAEKRRINDQIQEIGVQYQFLMQKLQSTLQQRREQFQQVMAPNLIQAIQEVVEEDGYDIVLRAEVALHYRTAYDITAKVTERLNRQN